MKKILTLIISLTACTAASAQELSEQITREVAAPNDTLYMDREALLDYFKPTLFSISSPWRNFGYSHWDIHQGFNASLDMGVMVGFGKYNPFKGASFFQNISGLYALPIGKRWTLAAGGELERYRIFNKYVNNLTVEGMAAYRLNERMTLTGFASHTFGKGGSPFYYPTMPYLMDNRTTFGADFGMKVTENFSFHVAVSMNNGDWGTPPQYRNENNR